MPGKKRALPEPPGRKGGGRTVPGGEGLIFDELQMAMAGGEKKLEEFMKENLPEGKYARKLTELMMGMSGMAPLENPSRAPGREMPEEMLHAARSGDVRELSKLLASERETKSAPAKEVKKSGKGKKPAAATPKGGEALQTEAGGQSLMEKELVDSLYEISVDMGLPMDWLIQRALKLYIRKYRETGQL